jgi:hypothetical protein
MPFIRSCDLKKLITIGSKDNVKFTYWWLEYILVPYIYSVVMPLQSFIF